MFFLFSIMAHNMITCFKKKKVLMFKETWHTQQSTSISPHVVGESKANSHVHRYSLCLMSEMSVSFINYGMV